MANKAGRMLRALRETLSVRGRAAPILASCAVVLGGLTACGGGSGGVPPLAVAQPAPPPTAAQPELVSCDDSMRTSFKPDPDTTVLLVKEFKVGDAVLLSGTATAGTPIAAHDLCLVKLKVGPGNPGPVDAPSTSAGIGIEIWLPSRENWNERIQNKGGDGWAGGTHLDITKVTSVSGSANSPLSAAEAGYVSGSTDTGHTQSRSGSFLMLPDGTINTVLWKDFAERGIHELALKTKALTKAYYGKDAKYAYFNGFSTGGRQGQKYAQVFPGDYNGILSGAPAINWVKEEGTELYGQVAVQRDLGGVALTPGQHSLVSNAAINACDMVGGQHLGYILDPSQCRYDPTIDSAVLCTASGGTNSTADCVTTAQASVFNKMWYGQTDDGSVPSPAADNGFQANAGTLAASQRWFGLTRGTDLLPLLGDSAFWIAPEQAALSLQDPRIAPQWSFVNATANGEDRWKNFAYADLAHAVERGLQLQPYFGDIETVNPDLGKFRDAGGKMLLYHGLSDPLIMPQGSIHYYETVAAKMQGIEAIKSFYRFYLIPGMGHGFLNETANPAANPPLPTNDQLFAKLVDWVENGKAPDRIDISTTATAPAPSVRSSPICTYPQKITYVSGDPNAAASYTCK